MSLHFLVSLTLMNGIQAFTCGIQQATKQSTPGILYPWSIYLHLLPFGNIAVTHIWQPMQVSGVEEYQMPPSGRKISVCIGGIMATQRSFPGFFLRPPILSRFTVYCGSGEVTLSLPRFQLMSIRFRSIQIADALIFTPRYW